VITSGTASTKALEGSTENKQFVEPANALDSMMPTATL